MIKPIKIAFIQDSPGSDIREPYMRKLVDFRPDILAFPEYYFVGPQFLNVFDSYPICSGIIERLRTWSRELDCAIVGGSLIEAEGRHKFNRCYLIGGGAIIGHYDKIHLYHNEGRGLLSPGMEYKVFEIGSLRVGMLICADVLAPGSFRNIRGLCPDIIFVPTTSRYRQDEPVEIKYKRDNAIFGSGAEVANAIMVKVSASGELTGRQLQGRSLIAFPGKIGWRIEPENEDKSALMMATIAGDLTNPSLDIRVFHL